jgi:hypothetical protein
MVAPFRSVSGSIDENSSSQYLAIGDLREREQLYESGWEIIRNQMKISHLYIAGKYTIIKQDVI